MKIYLILRWWWWRAHGHTLRPCVCVCNSSGNQNRNAARVRGGGERRTEQSKLKTEWDAEAAEGEQAKASDVKFFVRRVRAAAESTKVRWESQCSRFGERISLGAQLEFYLPNFWRQSLCFCLIFLFKVLTIRHPLSWHLWPSFVWPTHHW